MHPIHRRYHAEDLVRLRRAGERRRYAASQRQGRIDANPHQIDAVMFALRRIPDGGCILADEVGLGKTIEAGLVIVGGRHCGRSCPSQPTRPSDSTSRGAYSVISGSRE